MSAPVPRMEYDVRSCFDGSQPIGTESDSDVGSVDGWIGKYPSNLQVLNQISPEDTTEFTHFYRPIFGEWRREIPDVGSFQLTIRPNFTWASRVDRVNGPAQEAEGQWRPAYYDVDLDIYGTERVRDFWSPSGSLALQTGQPTLSNSNDARNPAAFPGQYLHWYNATPDVLLGEHPQWTRVQRPTTTSTSASSSTTATATATSTASSSSATLATLAPSDRSTFYRRMSTAFTQQLLTAPSCDPIALMSNLAALIYQSFRAYPGSVNWAGFYILRNVDPATSRLSRDAEEAAAEDPSHPAPSFPAQVLLLGPFHGQPAVSLIQLGKGVCGSAVVARQTQVVPDVHAHPNHIACDSASRSEIVVPIYADAEQTKMVGVLDMDSPVLEHFSEEDRVALEALVKTLGQKADWTIFEKPIDIKFPGQSSVDQTRINVAVGRFVVDSNEI